MLIRPKQLPIDLKDPFAADNLNRRESAIILSQLLERADTPFVFAIDAKWGDGKSTFIRMWQQELSNAGARCLYFNAWESDFTEDPLISFIGEIEGQFAPKGKVGEKVKLAKDWSAVKEQGTALAKRAVPAAIKLATAGLLDFDSFSEKVIADLAADVVKERIEKYQADKKTTAEFKNRLKEFLEELNTGSSKPIFPTVFFVDELDRCRPTYAIELLERIKHFFDIEGLVFVLALDKAQLGHSIRAVYGAGMDIEGYLSRFIDLTYRFPEPRKKEFLNQLGKQFDLLALMEKSEEGSSQRIQVATELFDGLAEMLGLSLRDQEQCFSTAALVLMTAPRGAVPLLLLPLLALIAIRKKEADLYNDFVNGKRSVKDVLDFINASPKGRVLLSEDHGKIFEAYLLSSRHRTDSSAASKIAYYQNSLLQTNHPDAPRGKRILELIDIMRKERDGDWIPDLARQIEISGRFKVPETPSKRSVS